MVVGDAIWRDPLLVNGQFAAGRGEMRCSPACGAAMRLCERGERGEGKIKLVLFLLIFASLIFVGFRTVPAYVAEYQLADKMQESARFAIVTRQSEEQVRETIYKVIQDLDIPVKKEDIKVVTTDRAVTISIDYRVPVDLLFFQTELHFTPSSENKSLI
jgi:hypothetical protein